MSRMKDRDYAVDLLRGIAIIVVVIGHAMQVCVGGGYHTAIEIIKSFQMPLMFFVSGMSLVYGYPDVE